MLRFWFDRGVDGFRIDVANSLVKESGLPDLPEDEKIRRARRG
ncbi:alpha-glucosidase [Cutibacterium acnes JCM 18909]|nr:alpha-glucosidase [Cutibacterium acnes JCM 18909]